MKKTIVFSLAVLMLMSAPVFAADKRVNTDGVMVNSKEAKIRSGPATSYAVLWRPRMYTPLEVLTKFIDEKGQLWFCVRDVEGDIGWLYHSVTEKGPGAIVTSANVTVRNEAGDKGSPLYQAPKNFTFKVLKEQKGWYNVADPDGDKGWVSKDSVWTGSSSRPKQGPRKD